MYIKRSAQSSLLTCLLLILGVDMHTNRDLHDGELMELLGCMHIW
jgi:hypothetical protein